MSHFSDECLANDPDAAQRLRMILHGPDAGSPAAVPSLSERFSVCPEAPAQGAARVDGSRDAAGPAPRPKGRAGKAADRAARTRKVETLATS